MKIILAFCIFIFANVCFALNVEIKAEVEGEEKPVILGKTNLPDGTKLTVTIRRKQSAYMAQDSIEVKNAGFRTVAFSQKGSALNDGKYEISISSPLAMLQPKSVQAVIGSDGSEMVGKYAKKSHYGGKVVEYKTSFIIGNAKGNTVKDKSLKEQDTKDMAVWWQKTCDDNCNLVAVIAQKRHESFNRNQCVADCLKKSQNSKR